MEPAHHTAFIDEAERKLRIIRGSLLVSLQEGRSAGLNIAGEFRRLREAASALNLDGVAAVLETIERESGHRFSHGQTLSDPEAYALLDLISHAEAEVVKLRFTQDETNVFDFVERSFDILQLMPEAPPAPGPPEPVAEFPEPVGSPEEDEFEPDAEMLEIFAMEAEELLANIESNLELLSSAPSDRDALWEIRRHAHTFKGAAGIIGLKQPSKLAHRIEDLLDHLAQNNIVPEPRVIELISSATSCLRAITRGDDAAGCVQRTAEVYRHFDETMSALAGGNAIAEPPAAIEPPVAAAENAGAGDVKTAAEPAPQRRPIVRVSIARLDSLVHIVRDLVVGRSAVEQRLKNFETQLEALSRTTRRLQAANAKIENDFEGSMLGSYMPAAFLRPRSAYRGDADLNADRDEFDALEFDRYTDFHESARDLSEAVQECFTIGTGLEALKASLETAIEDQRRLIEETQERVMQIRLIRFESLATRLQRAVRVTCEEERKNAEVVIENPDIEMDTDVLDALAEPLTHLLRNAVVHGIEPPETRRLLGKPETGRIAVRVANQETHIELKVSDDGRGIAGADLKERAVRSGMLDAAANAGGDDLVSLLALPGFTTAEKLTMSAGRGVGMGIVKESVEARGGTVSVETSLQQGTTFTIRIPLAFAVTQALLVRSGRVRAAVPFKAVKRIFEVQSADLRYENGSAFIDVGPKSFPAHRLCDHFAPCQPAGHGPTNALIIESNEETFALLADEILKTEEIAVKPLGKPLDKIEGVVGAAVLGNGDIVPVLDVAYFPHSSPKASITSGLTPAVEALPALVLVVDDSPSVRHITSKSVSSAGWRVVIAKDGMEALEILGGEELPDLILTDVEMPRMDGYELAAAVKANDRLSRIPIVFITSRAGEKHKELAAEVGVSEYLTKPFIESELLGTVERLTAVPEPVLT